MDEPALTEKLRRHGIGSTRQRLRIAQAMLAAPRHLCADDVLAEVNRDGAAVSKATVYNTLKLFTERGLVREVHVDPDRLFYDSTVGSHHHFYNPATGELMDIPGEALTVSGLPEPPPGTETAEVEVIVRLRERGDPVGTKSRHEPTHADNIW